MSPNGISSGFDQIFILSSSDSSDSESLLQEDIKSSGNQINQQWEAIERTLYQEPGPQVTDSELLKECKLWRDTFPHFRIKGTKIDTKQTGNDGDDDTEEADRKIQTLQNHFNLKKLEEKRQNIKTKVVGMLVDRLIAKYGPENGSANSGGMIKSGVQITEIHDDCSENQNDKSVNKNSETAISTDNESYFERGKLLNGDTIQDEQEEAEIREILNSWEKDPKISKKLPKAYRNNDLEKSHNLKYNFGVNCSDKPVKPKKFTPPSLGNITRPFEMTKKIDKKYEGLVDKIFERKSNELETIRHCRTSASELEMRNFEDSLEKLRIGSAFDDYMKRTAKTRINKFDNNWLKRSEMNFSYTEDSFPVSRKVQNSKPPKKTNFYGDDSPEEMDDKFIEDLKREMALNYKRPPKKSGVIEEVNLRRPKPFKTVEKPPKSLSCGELQKKNKKEAKGRLLKSGLDTGKKESNLKKPVGQLNNKGSRSNANQNSLLPPIESGIICTELTGRPKIGAKIPPKRY